MARDIIGTIMFRERRKGFRSLPLDYLSYEIYVHGVAKEVRF